MSDMPCRLFLVTPSNMDVEKIQSCVEQAAKAGDVASLLVSQLGSREDTIDLISALLPSGYDHNIAILVDDDPEMAAESGADGVQIAGDLESYKDARSVLGSDRIVGAQSAGTRHATMEIGEAGADYIAFDQSVPLVIGAGENREEVDPITWWAELFEIPAVAFAPSAFDDIEGLVKAGSNFIRPEDAMWSCADRAADTVKRYNARIEEFV